MKMVSTYARESNRMIIDAQMAFFGFVKLTVPKYNYLIAERQAA
jgi:hypothetical protein